MNFPEEPIPDYAVLYRFVGVNLIKASEEIRPAHFRDNRGSLSFDWCKYSNAEQTRARAVPPPPSDYGVVRILVSSATSTRGSKSSDFTFAGRNEPRPCIRNWWARRSGDSQNAIKNKQAGDPRERPLSHARIGAYASNTVRLVLPAVSILSHQLLRPFPDPKPPIFPQTDVPDADFALPDGVVEVRDADFGVSVRRRRRLPTPPPGLPDGSVGVPEVEVGVRELVVGVRDADFGVSLRRRRRLPTPPPGLPDGSVGVPEVEVGVRELVAEVREVDFGVSVRRRRRLPPPPPGLPDGSVGVPEVEVGVRELVAEVREVDFGVLRPRRRRFSTPAAAFIDSDSGALRVGHRHSRR